MSILTNEPPIDDKKWNTYPEKEPVIGSVFVGMDESAVGTKLLVYKGNGKCCDFHLCPLDSQEMPRHWINTPQGNEHDTLTNKNHTPIPDLLFNDVVFLDANNNKMYDKLEQVPNDHGALLCLYKLGHGLFLCSKRDDGEWGPFHLMCRTIRGGQLFGQFEPVNIRGVHGAFTVPKI